MKSYKFIIVLVALFLFQHLSISQNKKYDWSAQISLGKRSYHGDLGNGFFNYNQPFYAQFGIGLSKYLTRDFDVFGGGSLGDLGYWGGPDSNFLVRAIHSSIEGRYKLNNGYLLSKDFPIQPYISLGLGLTTFFPVDKRGKFAINLGLPMGLGAIYPINDRIEVFAHWRFIYNSGDKYDKIVLNDNKDHLMTGEIGVKYNFTINAKELDTDGDGILDKHDRCPKIKGIRKNHGCPAIKKSTKDVFKQALRGIQFEHDKSVIKSSSHAILDKIVDVMERNPYYNLTIAGHTSSDGKAEHNLELSKKRATSVKKYLIKKNIASNRLLAIGYGESIPIGDNTTVKGKALNRRVEFNVTFD